jgi:hypothetical protein
MNNRDFATLIAGLKDAGLSKAEVARQARPPMSRTTIHRCLTGGNRNHFIDTYLRVADVARRNGVVVDRGVPRREPIYR